LLGRKWNVGFARHSNFTFLEHRQNSLSVPILFRPELIPFGTSHPMIPGNGDLFRQMAGNKTAASF
jgi:hypothetical protein